MRSALIVPSAMNCLRAPIARRTEIAVEIAVEEDVVAGVYGKSNRLVEAIVGADRLHVEVVGNDHPIPAEPLAQDAPRIRWLSGAG